MKVTINYEKLTDAATKLGELASAIDSQRNTANSRTPIGLPTLGHSPLGPKAAWMRDQKPMLQGLADIALLLDTDGNGSSEFAVGNDIEDIREMLGETLAERGREVQPFDPEGYEAYLEVFSRWSTDETVTSSFHQTLGPEGTLRLLTQWADDDAGAGLDIEVQQRLLDQMRTSLETATQAANFPAEDFARGLVEQATIDPEELVGNGIYNPSGALAFLLYDGRFSKPFLETVAHDLDEYERVEMKGAPGLWGNRPDQGVDFSGFMPFGSGASPYENLDPMTSLMTALENDPQTALEFFSDTSAPEGVDSRALYYIRERTWDADGYQAISGVLDAATTHPDLIGDPTSDTAHDAAVLASRTVEYLSQRENINDLPEIITRTGGDASEHFAHILSTYMVGVDQTLSFGTDGDIDTGAENIYSDAFNATLANVPRFDEDGLQKFSLLAMASDDGFAQLRVGLNEYRATKMGVLADAVAEHDNAANRDALRDGIYADADLEGFFIRQLGDDKIAEGAEKDARINAWVDGASSIVDLVPIPGASRLGQGLANEVVNLTVDTARGQGADAIKAALATNEAQAVKDSNELADETLRQQEFLVAALLDERGLSANPDGMTDVVRPDGNLLSWEEFEKAQDRQMEILSQLYSNDLGVGEYFNRNEYEQTYRTQFQDYFESAKK